ncbi:cysteine/glutathione ABC transporter ATP-binding protein/permease CydC [Pasteurellaceae bacterium HPA106]|uniref:heme ABC transporter ATP-binding protein/permease CydC n=1 Tax=Spirabiliibacterium pneumoniae TaxID=221400 RepID=UPI001AADC37F|nr:cysteine/glutathione ABC transporter ATP-binding protein/permease CydC [Spirabiliibacterium pneumoniae]MBE2895618.1 cysteine/glutathione ABC transporter ATP-binding protein/permease CydC [Spirabiliibacterium pneumoniae]
MRAIFPFLALFKHAYGRLLFGVVLMILGLSASIGLLTLSGWFLAAAALAGSQIIFNFFYPSAGVRGLAIGRTAIRYAERLVMHDATFRVIAKLRIAVFAKLIPLTPGVLARFRNSDLLNRLVADVDTLDNLYLRLTAPFISALAVIAFLFFGLSLIDRTLAWVLVAFLLVLTFLVPFIFYQLGKKFGATLTLERARFRVRFIDWLQNHAELLLFNVEGQARHNLAQKEQQWQHLQGQEAALTGLSSAVVLLINGALLLTMLYLAGSTEFAQQHDFTLANIALFTFAALASFEIIMPLGAAFLRLGQVISAAQRINDITEQLPLVRFTGTRMKPAQSAVALALEQVHFHYPATEKAVLCDINLCVPTGEKLALLGKTGSGKSSLLQLLVRNFDPNEGRILLGGVAISDYTESALRAQMSVMSQRVYIFSDTLANNLRLAKRNASDDELSEVLSAVGLEYLLTQNEGLAQWLGDGGRPLSGGEQRRLGFARVLLHNAPIVLLDEPTEGLDRETEREMLSLILRHCQNKTLIMVTHRLTALEQFDRICIMDNARLVEQGHFATLAERQDSLFNRFIHRIG